MIKRIILLTLNFIPLTSWGALRDFGSPEKGSFSHSPLRAQLRTLQESLEMAPAAPLRIQDYVSLPQAAPQSPFLLLNDHVLTQQPEVADMLDAECVLAPSQTQDRRQSALVRVLVLNDTAPQSDRLFRQLRALQALQQPVAPIAAAAAFLEEVEIDLLEKEYEAASAARTKRPCVAQTPADTANAEIVFVEPDPVFIQAAPPSPARVAAQKAQQALEQKERMKVVRFEECIDALRTIQEELEKGDSYNPQTLERIVKKLNFLMEQRKTSTDEEFNDSVQHLHTCVMQTINASACAESPERPKQAKKTQVTPKRPKTSREIAGKTQIVFDLDQDPIICRSRARLAAITPPATSLHERLLPGLNVKHIEEGHVISNMPDLMMHNTDARCAVYQSRVNQVVCAMNPYVWEKPQKTFYPQRIAATDVNDHIIGKILLTLNDTARTKKIAKQELPLPSTTKKTAEQKPYLELFYSKKYGFPFVLVTREIYEDKGCLQGARRRSQTLYPIFSLVNIDEPTPTYVRLVDADVLNASEIKQEPHYTLDINFSNLLKLVIAMKNDATYKNDHFVSVDPEYIVVDIARYLHTHVGCPIEHGIIVRIKKTLLPSDY